MACIIELTLKGLTCGHCVARVKQCLEQCADVSEVRVTTERAIITGSATVQTLIDSIRKAGYDAAPVQEPPAPPKSASLAGLTQPESLTANNPLSPPEEVMQVQQLLITGMHCASCVSRVQQVLLDVAGVRQVQVNLAQRDAWITGDVSGQSLISALAKAGYQAQIPEDEAQWRERQQQAIQQEIKRFSWQACLALAAGIPLMIWGMAGNAMYLTADNRNYWLAAGVVTLLLLIVTGGDYYRRGWRSLLHRRATMDSLVALGTGAAWLYSMTVNLLPELFPAAARHLYYEACLMIIGLVNLGHMLESRGRRRSSTALQQLMDLTPPMVTLISAEGETRVTLSQVQPGMILRLNAGERVAVDGEITQGEVWIDESMLSGEPGAQHKQPGDMLYAGTLVQDGSVLFRARYTGKATTLARIIQLVRQAQSSKPAIARLADRVAAVFVPAVLAIALLSGGIWFIAGPAPQLVHSLVIMTTVLVIACPCALGLATPVSAIAGVARAAEFGVLVRDAGVLQQASDLDTLVFDKTGTLTEGKPRLLSIKTLADFPQQQALLIAAALEKASTHPLARAILQQAGSDTTPVVSDIRTLPGCGLSGRLNGVNLLLGNSAWLEREGINTGEFAKEMVSRAEQGATPVLLAMEGKAVALFTIQDPLRKDSVTALQRLKQAGYRLIMLTGDNSLTASAVAREAGIDEVIAGVLPEGKARVIENLQQQGCKVAMTGDGINDAPALALAQVSIAMADGSDIAIETAGITLMRHNLTAVADALAIASATLRNMKQNLAGAFIYNLIAIPVAAGILWPFSGILLNPVIAAGAMALSSVTVVANANRLLRFTPQK